MRSQEILKIHFSMGGVDTWTANRALRPLAAVGLELLMPKISHDKILNTVHKIWIRPCLETKKYKQTECLLCTVSIRSACQLIKANLQFLDTRTICVIVSHLKCQ